MVESKRRSKSRGRKKKRKTKFPKVGDKSVSSEGFFGKNDDLSMKSIEDYFFQVQKEDGIVFNEPSENERKLNEFVS